MEISKEKRDRIVAQARNEIRFARQYKQARISSWKKNEDMYYGRKKRTDDSRANVELGKMQGFIHTILSKIDSPLVFTFKERKEADLKKAKRLNALKDLDANNDNWDLKDILGKKQMAIYGRAIYCYYASSENGYRSNLEPVDVYDFLIDPAGGGYDLERAFYMGRFGIIKTKEQLKQGAKDGIYIKSAIKELTKDGSGNATELNQEEINKQNRYFNFAQTSMRQIENPDKYKFWEWYTTYDGERYYILMTESGQCIRCEYLTDIFASGLFPFWSYASFPDMTEFWTPSFADYVREIFMAQAISINQMIDNAEAINKPMKAVIVAHVENLAELKYRKDGYIRLKNTEDINKSFRTVEVPSIDTPIKLYQTLDTIQQLESGVTSASKGVANEDKVGIYEGNQQSTADRFGFLNKSYSFGYKRFALLYEKGVVEHLIKKVAVEMIGPDGVEVEHITRMDVKSKIGYTYIVKSSDAETNADAIDKRNKLVFLEKAGQYGPILNPKKMFEIGASIAGFTMDEIKEMLDVESWGNADLMSEASRDIEELLEGNDVKPNQSANIAYKQKMVDWLRDHQEDITMTQFSKIANYIDSLDSIIMRNTVRAMNNQIASMTMQGAGQLDPRQENINIDKTNLTGNQPTVQQDANASQYAS